MKLFVGVDVSKDKFDIHYHGKEVCVTNNLKGLKKLLSLLHTEIARSNEIGLIVCEATGGYENKLVKFMWANQMPIHRANPYRIRCFASAHGVIAKNDRLDAKVIAQYAEKMTPKADVAALEADKEALADLYRRREQLKQAKNGEFNRLDKELASSVVKSIKAHVKWLEKEIAKIETELEKLHKNTSISQESELLQSVPSVGDITAACLIAFLPELGKSKDKQLAALVGLAPFVKESGKYSGKRQIQGGRAVVRTALYMAALSSIRHYREMREFYHNLLSKGKPKKLALTAVARKLLAVLNSVVTRQSPWQETCPVRI